MLVGRVRILCGHGTPASRPHPPEGQRSSNGLHNFLGPRHRVRNCTHCRWQLLTAIILGQFPSGWDAGRNQQHAPAAFMHKDRLSRSPLVRPHCMAIVRAPLLQCMILPNGTSRRVPRLAFEGEQATPTQRRGLCDPCALRATLSTPLHLPRFCFLSRLFPRRNRHLNRMQIRQPQAVPNRTPAR
jgi:hypothetical protein